MEEICCPKFEPEGWDQKEFSWSEKRFIKNKVFTFFHVPINFGSVMKKLDKKARESGAKVEDNLCLSDHSSRWNMDVYLAVDREVTGIENVTLSGKFLSKVYEGPFQDTGKWCKDFEIYAKEKNLTIKKWYMWYTTCPKCLKKYGKNYVVIIAEV